MSRPTTGRLAAAAALAATLALSTPAAAAGERSPSNSLWQWLEGLLPQRIAALWTLGGGPEGVESGRAATKQGVCLDPDGCSAIQATPQGGPTCRQWNEAGGCIDPDG